MKELQKIRLLIRLFFKWWTLSALLGVVCPPIHQSVFFSRKFRRTTYIFLYIEFKKNGGLADDRMVKPKKADKKADRAKKVDEPFLPSSSLLPPYLILIPHAHGNGGAQVQGTVRKKYSGSASRAEREDFSPDLVRATLHFDVKSWRGLSSKVRLFRLVTSQRGSITQYARRYR